MTYKGIMKEILRNIKGMQRNYEGITCGCFEKTVETPPRFLAGIWPNGRVLKKTRLFFKTQLGFFQNAEWSQNGEKSCRNTSKTQKSITFFTINHTSFRHVEIPYKTNGKWSFWVPNSKNTSKIIKKALPTQRFRNAFQERQNTL